MGETSVLKPLYAGAVTGTLVGLAHGPAGWPGIKERQGPDFGAWSFVRCITMATWPTKPKTRRRRAMRNPMEDSDSDDDDETND